jgi:C_GCAxxG_C_C family probable redox protein
MPASRPTSPVNAAGLDAQAIQRLAEEAGRLADKRFRESGFHCSESVVRSVGEVLGLDLSPEVLMITTGFRGGGSGFFGQCGAMSGGMMMISLLYGRVQAEQSNVCAGQITKLFCERFERVMGDTSCHVLRDHYHITSSNDSCGAVYYTGAKLTVEVLLTEHHGCQVCGGFEGAIERHRNTRRSAAR